MFEQQCVPRPVQVAIIVAAFGRTEDRELDVIAAAGLFNRVQRLMQVAHKRDDPFKRCQPVARRSFFIAQYFLETFNAVHHAVVMIGERVFMLVLWTEAVALFGKAGCILWYIDK